MFFFSFILLFILLIIICLHLRYGYRGRLIAKMPAPACIPVLGHAYLMAFPMDILFKFFRQLHEKHGHFVCLYAFNYYNVNIYEPDDVEIILSSTRYNTKTIPYMFLKPWLGDGLLISNGKTWQHRRKMLTSAFHLSVLKNFIHIFNETTKKFLEKVEIETNKAQTDLLPFISDVALKIMYETSMGTSANKDTNSVSNRYIEAVHILCQCLIQRLTKLWLYADFIFNISNVGKQQSVALKDLHQFTKQIIVDRREYRKMNKFELNENDDNGKKNRLALLDLLLEEEKLGRITEYGIRSEVDTFLFAGHDTTASAFCFMIMQLANEKEIQNKIFEEVDRIFGDSKRSPTLDDINEMKYLECCIKESLRLYPSVPLIAREIKEEVILSGYKVPKDTICAVHVYDIHRRADLYPEPEKFIPERFLPENCDQRHPFAYIPFSAGPRNCIGQKFAMLEIKILMSGLLRRHYLEPITKTADLDFMCHVILRTKDPIFVRFCRRRKTF